MRFLAIFLCACGVTTAEPVSAPTSTPTPKTTTLPDGPKTRNQTIAPTEPTGPSSSTAPPSSGSDLYPLGAGFTWTYAWSATGPTAPSGCEETRYEVTKVAGDIYTIEITPDACDWGLTLRYKRDDEGDYFVNSDPTYWYFQLDVPPVLNAVWAAGAPSGAQYEWVAHFPSYTTSLGAYANCWKRKQVGYDNWEILCPGVGVVMMHYNAWGTFSEYAISAATF